MSPYKEMQVVIFARKFIFKVDIVQKQGGEDGYLINPRHWD